MDIEHIFENLEQAKKGREAKSQGKEEETSGRLRSGHRKECWQRALGVWPIASSQPLV